MGRLSYPGQDLTSTVEDDEQNVLVLSTSLLDKDLDSASGLLMEKVSRVKIPLAEHFTAC